MRARNAVRRGLGLPPVVDAAASYEETRKRGLRFMAELGLRVPPNGTAIPTAESDIKPAEPEPEEGD